MKRILVLLALATFTVQAQKKVSKKPTRIAMEKANWEFPNDMVDYTTFEGQQAAVIKKGAGGQMLTLKDVEFSTGTIEFDVYLGESNFIGISFHKQNETEGKWFYLRTHAVGKPHLGDAIQYCPTVKGVNLWNLYPQYQSAAVLKANAWNHIKLEVGKAQMLIYVNDENPTLLISELLGDSSNGSIAFNGEGMFANLTLHHQKYPENLDTVGWDATTKNPRYIRDWQTTAPILFESGRDVTDEDLPTVDTAWSKIETERAGLVNLSRAFAPREDGKRQLVWLKTTFTANENKIKKLDLGFTDEVWMYVNGQLLYLDKNYYRQPIMKAPNGRCSVENSSIEVPLKKGENEILIAVGNDFFGWGLVARWQNQGRL
ncbi:MAG: hypothetical protein AAFQ20_02100 [Bacteroidota bacterium]